MERKTYSRQFGLALSGGGFRAVLYHLGVIRFLRDANMLSQITQITSVSGGSVIGAHLALNWDRYCGSEAEFEQVSTELLRFLQLDIRNRIVRRFPLASMVNAGRRLIRLDPHRQYTRAGLLEQHYEKFLYGDTGLFNLPDNPRLYILATNLSEGSLCAFHRDGMLLQRRSRHDQEVRFEEVEMGLATVPMAVAASSAFPGFFPPLELRGKEIGAKEGEFDRHAFTDGGIYDNIGLRMFRHLQQLASQRSASGPTINVIDREAFAHSVGAGADAAKRSPHHELSERLLKQQAGADSDSGGGPDRDHVDRLKVGLAEVSRTAELYRDTSFHSLPMTDKRAQERLRKFIASGDQPDEYDRIWLNCELAAAALQQATGSACIRIGANELSGVFVSDAGASFKVRSDGRAGGMLSTALRSTDILMDRVNQLELESFADTPGVLFFPITRMLRRSQDATAPHLEIQRQAALIRTDMDRFSALEISALVQHGYCVARSVVQENAALSIDDLPLDPPWDPLRSGSPSDNRTANTLNDQPKILRMARTLQRSSVRRTISTLFDLRDWPTYVWLPLLAFLLFTLPYVFIESRRTAIQQGYVLAAIAETSPVYRDVLELLRVGPRPLIPTIEFEEVDAVEPLDFSGYDVVSDHRIYDLREWQDGEGETNAARMHARFRFRRTEAATDRPQVRIQLPSTNPQMRVEYLPKVLPSVHRRVQLDSGPFIYETSLDFSHVPIGSDATLLVNQFLPPNMAAQENGTGWFKFTIAADTGLARIWVLLPEGRRHDHFELNRYPIDHPEHVELVEATTTVELPTGSIATFELIKPKNNYRYECRWHWRDAPRH